MDVKVFNAGKARVDEENFADGQAVWSLCPAFWEIEKRFITKRLAKKKAAAVLART
jgi:hypothetical protein